jgi:hypothetical protein
MDEAVVILMMDGKVVVEKKKREKEENVLATGKVRKGLGGVGCNTGEKRCGSGRSSPNNPNTV